VTATATPKLLQERGETFRDRLVGGIVFGPEPLLEFPHPWPSGQDVTTFGLARPTLPARPRKNLECKIDLASIPGIRAASSVD
jgi:hypothetical protein